MIKKVLINGNQTIFRQNNLIGIQGKYYISKEKDFFMKIGSPWQYHRQETLALKTLMKDTSGHFPKLVQYSQVTVKKRKRDNYLITEYIKNSNVIDKTNKPSDYKQ